MSKRSLIMSAVLVLATVTVGAEELQPPPALASASEVPVRLRFSEPTPATEIYQAVGTAAGVEIVFGPRFNEHPLTIDIETSTTSAAFDLVSAAAGDLWVPTAGNTVIVADDTPQNHRQYEPMLVQSFALENGSVREADKLLRSIVNVRNIAVNEELRTVTVRETAGKMPIIEHLMTSVDHPPGEIDARIELLRLSVDPGSDPPPSRFAGDEYAAWRRTAGAVPLANSTLSLLGRNRANLHLGSLQPSGLGLDLRLEGRVHPESRDVTLEVRAILSPTRSKSEESGQQISAKGSIETTARLTGGSTLLLRIPGTESDGIAVAITPTIVRGTEFDPAELDAVWVGTETRIQASR